MRLSLRLLVYVVAAGAVLVLTFAGLRIHQAALNQELVEALVPAEGIPPRMGCGAHDKCQTVDRLLREGADPNARANIHPARSLMDMLRDLVPRHRSTAPSALEMAMYSGDLQSMSLLLDGGADPNTVASCGEPLIAKAAADEFAEGVVALAQHGARIGGARDHTWSGPAGLAGWQLLDEPVLCSLARGHGSDAIEPILARGADPNEADGYGHTPLMWAASRGDLSSIRTLLGHGADVSRRDHSGGTALAAARGLTRRPIFHRSEIIALLARTPSKQARIP